MTAIVDYGMGNLGSIANMIKRIGGKALISSDKGELERAERLILPGVGSFDNGMRQIHERGLYALLNELVIGQGKPLLGICLGMQLLTRRSEEGQLPGLGWLDAETVRFRFGEDLASLRIPHMGWNTVEFKRKDRLVPETGDESRFYFVHSYHLVCSREEDVLATTRYGYEFPSVVHRGNIFGTQFHPEKSHRFGMTLLRRFMEVR
jgi:imidazole glycerol-phosphate synthase subunit HisH